VFTHQELTRVIDAERIIFSHDFAKALWGEEELQHVNQAFSKVVKDGWRRHLQQMVIAEDPIKYLGENLE